MYFLPMKPPKIGWKNFNLLNFLYYYLKRIIWPVMYQRHPITQPILLGCELKQVYVVGKYKRHCFYDKI